MIDKAHDAERWNKAARIARAKEMSVIHPLLKVDERVLKVEHLRLKRKLFFVKCRRLTRYLFIQKPRMLLMKCRILRLNAGLFSINLALFVLQLKDKFSAHKRPNVVATETPNFPEPAALKQLTGACFDQYTI